MDPWLALLALSALVMPLLLAWALLAWRDKHPKAARRGQQERTDP